MEVATHGRDAAEDRLRAAITRGEMPPGHRMVEADLAEDLGVTRNAVRLAIDALIAEGLVERIPNRGARVRTVSVAEAIEIVECRTVLEGLLAAKAAERITDAEIDRLRTQTDAMERAVADGDLLEYSALVAQLHALIRDAARQATAGRLIERLQAQIVRHQFQLSLRPGRARLSSTELHRVVEAIAARDPRAAEAAARSHLQSVVAALAESTAH
ncbi:GntR family transcriptional regulator [Geodermatophilus sp. CPCC 205506]|uniref:GntR family transcriptional regulator n=1 Tax=Geodermatophilus sp. CPCC 205506 TaxID=2936596 RepID=UPI003EECDACB